MNLKIQPSEPTEFFKELDILGEYFWLSTVSLWRKRTGLPCKLLLPQNRLMIKDGVYRIGVFNSHSEHSTIDQIIAMSVCDAPEILSDIEKIIFSEDEIKQIKKWIIKHQSVLRDMADEKGDYPEEIFRTL